MEEILGIKKKKEKRKNKDNLLRQNTVLSW